MQTGTGKTETALYNYWGVGSLADMAQQRHGAPSLSFGMYGRNGASGDILEPFSVPTLGKSQFLRLYAFDF